MTTGQIFFGGMALLSGFWMTLKFSKALRTGRVLMGESPFANAATKANEPALYWLVVIAQLIGAVVAVAAGACAFLLWGPN